MLAFALALLIATLCWSVRLHAQPASEVELRRIEAKRHFERGVAFVRAGQSWDAALAEFIASRELYRTKSATRNAAIALLELNRPAEALRYYTLLVAEFSEAIAGQELVELRAEMSRLRGFVAELDVQANVAGATVIVEGRPYGTTPLVEPVVLDPGTHSIKLTKDGFEATELVLSMASGQRRSIRVALRRLRATGTLVVLEANSAVLDVVLDAAVVGRTPWTGSVPPGMHSVLLRGKLGTAPSAAEVRVDRTTTLTLRAQPLKSALLIEPEPSNASVYIDGVAVGNGIWDGQLPNGIHRVEVVANGHLPFRRDVTLSGVSREAVRARLDRDQSSALWKDVFRAHGYGELVMGALLARSFHGGADDWCRCTERSRPFGGLVGLRVGYAPLAGAGVELLAGYLSISESMTRELRVQGEPNLWATTDYRDSTRLRGGFAALGVSYRLLDETPITARLGVGVAALSPHTKNGGNFSANLRNPAAPSEARRFDSYVTIEETSRTLLTPFVSTEVRAGYRVSPRLSIDIGIGLMLFLPPPRARGGTNSFSDDSQRSTQVDRAGGVWNDGEPLRPGVLTLPPDEAVAGAFLPLSPSLGMRWDF